MNNRQIEYRTKFLKSEQWHTVRVERLAKDNACCVICGFRSLSNDEHHVAYPSRWECTKATHLRTLCRECHNFVHSLYFANGKDVPESYKAFGMMQRFIKKWLDKQIFRWTPKAPKQKTKLHDSSPLKMLREHQVCDINECHLCRKKHEWISVVNIAGFGHPRSSQFVWPVCFDCLTILKQHFMRSNDMKIMRNSMKFCKHLILQENSSLTENPTNANVV